MVTLNRQEALRYLGVKGSAPEALAAQVEEAAHMAEAALQPRWVWKLFPLVRTDEGYQLQGTGLTLAGRSAETMLQSCHHAALMVCTLGAAADRLLWQTQQQDMAQALVLDACLSALVEAGCEAAQGEIAARCAPWHLTDRFSPGYGDLPLSLQPALLQAVDAGRRVGVSALPSLLMTPQKSISAIVGLADVPQPARVRGCAHCSLRGSCACGGHGGCGI